MAGFIDELLAGVSVKDVVKQTTVVEEAPAEPQETPQNAPTGNGGEISHSIYGEQFMKRYGR